jgi:hypothetical protein
MKILGDRNLGGRHGNDIQIAFCLYTKHIYPPPLLAKVYVQNRIKVYNRFDELPGKQTFIPPPPLFLLLQLPPSSKWYPNALSAAV